jgi:hypothetical protein
MSDLFEINIDIDEEYREMMQELLRVITVACTIQLIKTMTFGSPFFSEMWVEATLTTTLGFIMYYMVTKKIIIFT